MTVEHIFTKIGISIENRQIFMLLNCNCAKLANKILNMLRGAVFRGHRVFIVEASSLGKCRAGRPSPSLLPLPPFATPLFGGKVYGS